MKSIKALFALALATSFAAAAWAATETAPPLVRVPKTEAAMQATRETTARDAASSPVPSASHKTKATQAKTKAKENKTTAKQTKKAPAKKLKAKGHAAK